MGSAGPVTAVSHDVKDFLQLSINVKLSLYLPHVVFDTQKTSIWLALCGAACGVELHGHDAQ